MALKSLLTSSLPFPKPLPNPPRRPPANTFHAHKILHVGLLHGFCRPQTMQQRLFAFCADAGDLVETREPDSFRAPRAMRANGEAMRFIAQALQVIKGGIIMLNPKGSLPPKEMLAPGVAVGTFGDADNGNIVNAEFFQNGSRFPDLPGAAVDQKQVRPQAQGVFGIFVDQSFETARQEPLASSQNHR